MAEFIFAREKIPEVKWKRWQTVFLVIYCCRNACLNLESKFFGSGEVVPQDCELLWYRNKNLKFILGVIRQKFHIKLSAYCNSGGLKEQ